MPTITKSKRASFADGTMTNEMVTVFVGRDQKPFHVHKDAISYSDYFNAAFNCGMRETQTGELRLPPEDADEETFGRFLNWIYTGRLCKVPYTNTGFEHDMESDQMALYVFADRYNIVELKNDLISLLIEYFEFNARQYALATSVLTAFTQLSERDPIKSLFIDLWTFRFNGRLTKDQPATDLAALPAEFWRAVAVRKGGVQFLRTSSLDPVLRGRSTRCFYHDHTPGFVCDGESGPEITVEQRKIMQEEAINALDRWEAHALRALRSEN